MIAEVAIELLAVFPDGPEVLAGLPLLRRRGLEFKKLGLIEYKSGGPFTIHRARLDAFLRD
jgi:hypothetical protein